VISVRNGAHFFCASSVGRRALAARVGSWRADIVRTLQRLIPSSARVLEIGVGDGTTLAALRNPVRHGIDALPESVELAANSTLR